MLGKTANGLFWMSRYLERAENTTRLIETGQRLALTRLGDDAREWASVLQSAGSYPAFMASHEELTKEAAINWMLRDRDNPSSIRACIESARQNARLVRTAITGEAWEAINAAYMTARESLARKVTDRDLPEVLQRLRQGTALVRGMILGTMMRTEAFDFQRIGTFLERADYTARILDVKYYVLLPSVSAVGSTLDNVHWESILRAVSGRGGFRVEYGASGGPREIVHFLVLDRRMPRSLAFCVGKIEDNLRYLDPEGRTDSLQKVRALRAQYLSHDVAAVFDYGLHEFIQSVLSALGDVAVQIERDFRFYE
ncbi:MAG: alpha-E domain-containing protein [Roseovarius sp.]|nr:alpha-E domain-containing protein [Roseovarius sp.]